MTNSANHSHGLRSRWPFGKSSIGVSRQWVGGSSKSNHFAAWDRSIALRIEDDRMVLAIATQSADAMQLNEPVDQVLVDQIVDTEGGWLNAGRWSEMTEALATLTQRHQIGHTPVAVSLSGDFCVTRISVGSVDDVDRELTALAGRIPRYLQLGPGGKVTGQTRDVIGPGIEHALTAVGNRVRVQNLYEVFRTCDVEVAWMEPSLVSLARFVGWLGLDREAPVLIADSFGQSWEVGIASEGRLLLDYRPAAARDGTDFAKIIDQHLDRLQRFCQRHRGMSDHQLSHLFVGGADSKVDPVVEYFRGNTHLHVSAFDPDDTRWSIHRAPAESQPNEVGNNETVPIVQSSDTVAVLAAVLPLVAEHSGPSPDLLQEIRRDHDKSRLNRMITTYWPAAAAVLVLALGFGGLLRERERANHQLQQRQFMETQVQQTQVRMANVQQMRDYVTNLKQVEDKTFSPPISELVLHLAQCLPAQTKLRSLRMDSEHQLHLEGWTAQENDIYDVISYVRRVPEINQVALLGTSGSTDDDGSLFDIRLGWQINRVRATGGASQNE